MATLTINPQRQLTLDSDLVEHLGQPGDQVEVSLAEGHITLSRSRSTLRGNGRWEDFFGFLAGKTDKVATIEELNEAIARGWAGLDRGEDVP